MFDTPVSEITLLVADPSHPRFGQTAQLEAHDWKECGALFAKFPDGTSEGLHDGLMSNDASLPQAMRIKTGEAGMVLSIQRKLPDVRDKLTSLASVANDKKLPMELRIHAKKLF